MTKGIRGWCTWVGMLLLSAMFCIGGCASQVEEPAARVRKQAFSVNDDLTPRAMRIALPPQATLRGSVLTATASLELAAGAQVLGGTGPGSLAISLGGRPTELGTGAQLVGLVTRAGAQLAARSTITGSIITAGPVTRDNTSTIQGTVQDHAILDPLKTYSWSVAREAGSNVSIRSDQIVSLAPGTFGSVSVASRGSLKLQSGVYKFSSLLVKAGATVELPATGRVVTHIFDDWSSQGTWQSSNAANTLFVFYGDEVSLARGFVGTVVASNAQIEIGSGAFEGAFFGKEVLLGAGARVHHVPFTGWDSVLPPKPFLTCVSQVGPGRFAALFGYESPLDHTVNIPVGPSNNLAPTGSGSVPPVATFSPGRQERALWAQLINGELTWSLGGQSARATPLSTGCSVEVAYPSQPDTQPRGDGPSPPLGLKGKPPPYSFESRVVASPSASNINGTTLANGARPLLAAAPAVGSLPFALTITKVAFQPDQTLGTLKLDVDSWIEDQHFGARRVHECDADFCVANNYVAVQTPVTFSRDLPATFSVVNVGLVLREDDTFSSENLVYIDMTIDRATGLVLAGVVSGRERRSPTAMTPGLNCVKSGGNGLCWSVEVPGPPQVSGNTQICANWTASFVDEGFGESKQGKALGSDGLRTYPARFAQYQLKLDNGAPSTFAQSGFLDSEGCITGGVPSQQLVFNNSTPLGFTLTVFPTFSTQTGSSTIDYSLGSAVPNIPLEVIFAATSNGQPPLDQWVPATRWSAPPARIDLQNAQYTPITNVAATISAILGAPDNGIAPGAYTGVYGDGCRLKDIGTGIVTSIDSCFDGTKLLIGPATKPVGATACRADHDCPGAQLCYEDTGSLSLSPMPCIGTAATCSCMWPDQSRWKYVSTHEAGHQFQARAAGPLAGDGYDFDCPAEQPDCGGERSRFNGRLVDPALMDERCGCQHVKAANADHCLQSIERSGDAQKEGYAQFFGSRIWNDKASPTCTFVYYKELAQEACLPGFDCTDFAAPNANLTLKVHLPPVPISCTPPVGDSWFKWRNSYCPMGNKSTQLNAAEMGTERDWMGFLYGVNTGAGATTMSDVHLIYRHACNPPAAGQPPPELPPRCSGQQAAWKEVLSVRGTLEKAGFVEGVQRRFFQDQEAINRITIRLGDGFGVSENLQ